MTFYDDRILPHVINFACSTKPVQKQRKKIVPLAEGDVLEIGFGSGLNLAFYDTQKVRKIWGLEPSVGMRRKAQPMVNASGLDVEFIDLPGESVRRWQHRLNPAWGRIAGGCNMNRDIPDLITRAGFRLTADERMYVPGLKMLSFNYWGRARAA